MAEGLHRVGVEGDARLVGGRRQLANRLDGADLVVGEHDGGQDGVRADGRLEVLNAHESVLVHGKIGHLEALALQRLAGVKHRVVLDGARDDVAPLGGVGPGEALEGPVVRFGAAAREEDFARRRADEAGQALAGGSHGVGGLLAQGVNGGRIAEMLGEVGGHGLHHFGANGRRGRMVKVDLPHGAPASASGMDSPGTVLGRGRAPPSKSSNLLEFNIIGLRRLSRTSYDCYHIHDDFPRKATSVKISTKTRYGMRFMIDLAQSQGEGRVALKDIADRQGLSKKYLEQVVAPLASAGLLDVTRGNQGGYRLSRDASAITLADIVAASEDGLELLDCMGSLSACERAEDCPSRRCGAAFKWRSAIISPGSPSPTSPLPPPLPTCNLPPDLFRVSCVITCAATREDAVEDEGKKVLGSP